MASSKGDGSQIVGLTRGSERNSYDIRVELWAYGCGKVTVHDRMDYCDFNWILDSLVFLTFNSKESNSKEFK